MCWKSEENTEENHTICVFPLFWFLLFAEVGMKVEVWKQQNQTDAVQPLGPQQFRAKATVYAQSGGRVNHDENELKLSNKVINRQMYKYMSK